MDTNQVSVSIMEPSGGDSRRRLSAALIGGDLSPSLDEIKKRLAEIRHRFLDEHVCLTQRFQTQVAGSPGAHLKFALNAADAVTAIRDLAGDTRSVVVNRSAVVLNELGPGLVSSGFRVLEPYYDEAGSLESKIDDYCDLPGLVRQGLLPDFVTSHEYPCVPTVAFPNGEMKDCVGVLGVSAAAAEDGSVFLLQHFSNIARTLRQVRHLVLVVALDKLVGSREEAEFQTRCMGLFGLESMLLNLAPGQGARKVWDDVPDAAPGKRQTLHLILLDNGRSRILNGVFRDLLLCIGCRACLRQCPIARSMNNGSGATWSPRDYLFAYLRGDRTSLDACLHCEACRIDCPLSIDLPGLMWVADRTAGKRRRLPELMLGNAETLARAGSLTAPVSNVVMGHGPGKLMKACLGLDAKRDLPRFHRLTFRDWSAGRKVRESAGAGERPLVYFVGCFANYYEPKVARAVVRLLETTGCKILLAREKCCGLPMIANKNRRGFLRNAEHNINVLAPFVEEGADIVTACPSCALMLRREYPELIGGSRSVLVSQHTQYVEHYLVNMRSHGKPVGLSRAEARPIFYHIPCHLKALDGFEAFLDSWRHMPGLSVGKMSASCCGLGGYHGYKKAYSASSREIGGRLFADVGATDAELVVSSCAACRLQIAQNTGVRVCHPIQLLEDIHRSPVVHGEVWPDQAVAVGRG